MLNNVSNPTCLGLLSATWAGRQGCGQVTVRFLSALIKAKLGLSLYVANTAPTSKETSRLLRLRFTPNSMFTVDDSAFHVTLSHLSSAVINFKRSIQVGRTSKHLAAHLDCDCQITGLPGYHYQQQEQHHNSSPYRLSAITAKV